MLKLLKYDFIQSYRAYSMIFALFFLLSFMASSIVYDNFIKWILFSVLISLTVIIIVLFFINTIKHFNSSMYRKSGYLTLTLPVSTHKIVLSKFIANFIWFVLGIILLIFGVFIVIIFSSENILIGLYEVGNIINIFFKEIITNNKSMLTLLFFFSFFASFILELYFIISLVNTKISRNNKVFAGIMIFILITIITGILNQSLHFYDFFNFINLDSYYFYNDFPSHIFWGFALSVLSVNIFYSLVYYYLTIYIIDNMIEI